MSQITHSVGTDYAAPTGHDDARTYTPALVSTANLSTKTAAAVNQAGLSATVTSGLSGLSNY